MTVRVETSRLRAHPQVRRRPEIVMVWTFDCAACGESYYLRAAYPESDGSLRCRGCSTTGSPALEWCPGCQRSLPAKAFARKRPADPQLRALVALLGQGGHKLCVDCRTRPTPVRRCQRCGEPLASDARADARFCSTRCRVAAYRAGP
jgi:hypothetical protein